MAFGLHWEWRGFGSASDRFSDLFGAVEPAYGPHDVEDLYIWRPHLPVNAKIRSGPEGGLKFKWIRNTDGDLEQWSENPDEVFPFPLSRTGWETLAGALAGVESVLAPYPAIPPAGDTVIGHLMDSGCKLVSVHKRRQGRLWKGSNGHVLVELAHITRPEPVISLGLESRESGGEGYPDQQAKADLLAAIAHFRLHDEPLRSMNYMDALAIWATGGTVRSGAPP